MHSPRLNEKNLTMTAPDRNIRFAIFPVVTNFETMAAAGGLPRDKALLNARIRVQRLIGRGGKSAMLARAARHGVEQMGERGPPAHAMDRSPGDRVLAVAGDGETAFAVEGFARALSTLTSRSTPAGERRLAHYQPAGSEPQYSGATTS